MSGHSHFSSIKHKKALTDAKRSKVFSKLTRQLSVAAREKGGDPDSNPKLRVAIDQAKEANMPSNNIERAIKKGTGELAGEKLEEFLFEAYGPGGVAILIEGITDNKNRSLGEIKQTMNHYGGKLVSEGGARWLFERKADEQGSLEWVAKQDMEVSDKDKESLEKLFETLDENDSVQDIYSNLKL
jgi:YebC/PmpR family DNA-binding regulatory protein